MLLRLQRSIILTLAFVFLFTNCLFAHLPEKNFWEERRAKIGARNQALGIRTGVRHQALGDRTNVGLNPNSYRLSPIRLASLPAGLQLPSPALLPHPQPFSLKGEGSLFPLPSGRGTKGEGEISSLIRSLPPLYGNVRNISQPSPSPLPVLGEGGKVVIHIQDVHLNPEAQQNIGKALRELINSGQVGLVALEGAFDPIDLSGFRRFPHQDTIRKVADYLLKENKISGPIHALLTIPSHHSEGARSATEESLRGLNNREILRRPFEPPQDDGKDVPLFVGVDDRTHYQSNVEAYRQSSQHQKEYKQQWAALKNDLEQRKKAVLNPQLLEFDSKLQAFHEGNLKLGEYVRFLSRHSEEGPRAPTKNLAVKVARRDSSVVSLPQNDISTGIKTFLQALDLEEHLNFSQVEQERSRLLAQLVKKLSKAQISELMNYSIAYRLGSIGHADFYGYLKGLCQKSGIDLGPMMSAYIQYVLISENIDMNQLTEDIHGMEEKAYASLLQTDEERKLIEESKRLYLVGKLLDFALTPEEWKEYKNSKQNAVGNQQLPKDKKISSENCLLPAADCLLSLEGEGLRRGRPVSYLQTGSMLKENEQSPNNRPKLPHDEGKRPSNGFRSRSGDLNLQLRRGLSDLGLQSSFSLSDFGFQPGFCLSDLGFQFGFRLCYSLLKPLFSHLQHHLLGLVFNLVDHLNQGFSTCIRQSFAQYFRNSHYSHNSSFAGRTHSLSQIRVPSQSFDLTPFESFYLEAEARDQAMTQNLLKAVEKNKSKVAVLVTGGFHSHGMDERLKEAGLTIIAFVPRITHVDSGSGSAYLSVFTQEKTPLEKLFQGERLFLTPDMRPGILKALEMELAFENIKPGLPDPIRRCHELLPRFPIQRVNARPVRQTPEGLESKVTLDKPKGRITMDLKLDPQEQIISADENISWSLASQLLGDSYEKAVDRAEKEGRWWLPYKAAVLKGFLEETIDRFLYQQTISAILTLLVSVLPAFSGSVPWITASLYAAFFASPLFHKEVWVGKETTPRKVGILSWERGVLLLLGLGLGSLVDPLTSFFTQYLPVSSFVGGVLAYLSLGVGHGGVYDIFARAAGLPLAMAAKKRGGKPSEPPGPVPTPAAAGTLSREEALRILEPEQKILQESLKDAARQEENLGQPIVKDLPGDMRSQAQPESGLPLQVVIDLKKIRNQDKLIIVYWRALHIHDRKNAVMSSEVAYPTNPEAPLAMLRLVTQEFFGSETGQDESGKKLLELGTGDGTGAIALARNGAEVVAMDISKKMLGYAHENASREGVLDRIKLFVGDAAIHNQPSDIFDGVYGRRIGVHILPGARILMFQQALRVLKPGAALTLVEPATNTLQQFLKVRKADGSLALVETDSNVSPMIWTADQWKAVAQKAGFENVQVQEINYGGELMFRITGVKPRPEVSGGATPSVTATHFKGALGWVVWGVLAAFLVTPIQEIRHLIAVGNARLFGHDIRWEDKGFWNRVKSLFNQLQINYGRAPPEVKARIRLSGPYANLWLGLIGLMVLHFFNLSPLHTAQLFNIYTYLYAASILNTLLFFSDRHLSLKYHKGDFWEAGRDLRTVMSVYSKGQGTVVDGSSEVFQKAQPQQTTNLGNIKIVTQERNSVSSHVLERNASHGYQGSTNVSVAGHNGDGFGAPREVITQHDGNIPGNRGMGSSGVQYQADTHRPIGTTQNYIRKDDNLGGGEEFQLIHSITTIPLGMRGPVKMRAMFLNGGMRTFFSFLSKVSRFFAWAITSPSEWFRSMYRKAIHCLRNFRLAYVSFTDSNYTTFQPSQPIAIRNQTGWIAKPSRLLTYPRVILAVSFLLVLILTSTSLGDTIQPALSGVEGPAQGMPTQTPTASSPERGARWGWRIIQGLSVLFGFAVLLSVGGKKRGGKSKGKKNKREKEPTGLHAEIEALKKELDEFLKPRLSQKLFEKLVDFDALLIMSGAKIKPLAYALQAEKSNFSPQQAEEISRIIRDKEFIGFAQEYMGKMAVLQARANRERRQKQVAKALRQQKLESAAQRKRETMEQTRQTKAARQKHLAQISKALRQIAEVALETTEIVMDGQPEEVRWDPEVQTEYQNSIHEKQSQSVPVRVEEASDSAPPPPSPYEFDLGKATEKIHTSLRLAGEDPAQRKEALRLGRVTWAGIQKDLLKDPGKINPQSFHEFLKAFLKAVMWGGYVEDGRNGGLLVLKTLTQDPRFQNNAKFWATVCDFCTELGRPYEGLELIKPLRDNDHFKKDIDFSVAVGRLYTHTALVNEGIAWMESASENLRENVRLREKLAKLYSQRADLKAIQDDKEGAQSDLNRAWEIIHETHSPLNGVINRKLLNLYEVERVESKARKSKSILTVLRTKDRHLFIRGRYISELLLTKEVWDHIKDRHKGTDRGVARPGGVITEFPESLTVEESDFEEAKASGVPRQGSLLELIVNAMKSGVPINGNSLWSKNSLVHYVPKEEAEKTGVRRIILIINDFGEIITIYPAAGDRVRHFNNKIPFSNELSNMGYDESHHWNRDLRRPRPIRVLWGNAKWGLRSVLEGHLPLFEGFPADAQKENLLWHFVESAQFIGRDANIDNYQFLYTIGDQKRALYMAVDAQSHDFLWITETAPPVSLEPAGALHSPGPPAHPTFLLSVGPLLMMLMPSLLLASIPSIIGVLGILAIGFVLGVSFKYIYQLALDRLRPLISATDDHFTPVERLRGGAFRTQTTDPYQVTVQRGPQGYLEVVVERMLGILQVDARIPMPPEVRAVGLSYEPTKHEITVRAFDKERKPVHGGFTYSRAANVELIPDIILNETNPWDPKEVASQVVSQMGSGAPVVGISFTGFERDFILPEETEKALLQAALEGFRVEPAPSYPSVSLEWTIDPFETNSLNQNAQRIKLKIFLQDILAPFVNRRTRIQVAVQNKGRFGAHVLITLSPAIHIFHEEEEPDVVPPQSLVDRLSFMQRMKNSPPWSAGWIFYRIYTGILAPLWESGAFNVLFQGVLGHLLVGWLSSIGITGPPAQVIVQILAFVLVVPALTYAHYLPQIMTLRFKDIPRKELMTCLKASALIAEAYLLGDLVASNLLAGHPLAPWLPWIMASLAHVLWNTRALQRGGVVMSVAGADAKEKLMFISEVLKTESFSQTLDRFESVFNLKPADIIASVTVSLFTYLGWKNGRSKGANAYIPELAKFYTARSGIPSLQKPLAVALNYLYYKQQGDILPTIEAKHIIQPSNILNALKELSLAAALKLLEISQFSSAEDIELVANIRMETYGSYVSGLKTPPPSDIKRLSKFYYQLNQKLLKTILMRLRDRALRQSLEVSDLKQAFIKSGAHVGRTAALLNKPPQTVSGQLIRHGIQRDADVIEALRKRKKLSQLFIESGGDVGETTRKTGESKQKMQVVLNRLGIPDDPEIKRSIALREELLKTYLENGCRVDKTAQKLKKDSGYVSTLLKKFKIRDDKRVEEKKSQAETNDRHSLIQAFAFCNGNVVWTASRLGLPPTTLRKRLDKYGIRGDPVYIQKLRVRRVLAELVVRTGYDVKRMAQIMSVSDEADLHEQIKALGIEDDKKISGKLQRRKQLKEVYRRNGLNAVQTARGLKLTPEAIYIAIKELGIADDPDIRMPNASDQRKTIPSKPSQRRPGTGLEGLVILLTLVGVGWAGAAPAGWIPQTASYLLGGAVLVTGVILMVLWKRWRPSGIVSALFRGLNPLSWLRELFVFARHPILYVRAVRAKRIITDHLRIIGLEGEALVSNAIVGPEFWRRVFDAQAPRDEEMYLMGSYDRLIIINTIRARLPITAREFSDRALSVVRSNPVSRSVEHALMLRNVFRSDPPTSLQSWWVPLLALAIQTAAEGATPESGLDHARPRVEHTEPRAGTQAGEIEMVLPKPVNLGLGEAREGMIIPVRELPERLVLPIQKTNEIEDVKRIGLWMRQLGGEQALCLMVNEEEQAFWRQFEKKYPQRLYVLPPQEGGFIVQEGSNRALIMHNVEAAIRQLAPSEKEKAEALAGLALLIPQNLARDWTGVSQQFILNGIRYFLVEEVLSEIGAAEIDLPKLDGVADPRKQVYGRQA